MTYSYSTLPKSWKDWIDIGSDVNWEDYGGLWAKRSPEHSYGVWYILQFMNMIDACGEKEAEEIGYVYKCEVSMVNLTVVDGKTLVDAASEFLDYPDMDARSKELALVYSLASGGTRAILHTETGKTNPSKVRRLAYLEAERLMRDDSRREEKLDQPYNAIGTTNREVMGGDILAGLRRSAEDVMLGKSVDPKASLMLRMYGATGGQTLGGTVETDLAVAGLMLKKE